MAWIRIDDSEIEAVLTAVTGPLPDLARRIREQREEMTPDERAALIKAARAIYAAGSSDDIEVDNDAAFSTTDDGTWVQMWGYVRHEDEPAGDDLCDRCMRSGVEVSHTEDGDTVCTECAADDGCPKSDPDCYGPADGCHDACESPENATGKRAADDEQCDGCDNNCGIRPDSTPHSGQLPAGFVAVERCDICQKYPDDHAAAVAWGGRDVTSRKRDTICRPPENAAS
jgi:hypothetical protein